jgi:hypothetical protein
MNELSERDRLLAKRLAATLDQAAARPDPALEQALAAARARARQPDARVHHLRPWMWASGMALAAGLAVVAVLPGTAPVRAIAPQAAPVAKAAGAQVDDPEMLEDLDMLQALSADSSQGHKS